MFQLSFSSLIHPYVKMNVEKLVSSFQDLCGVLDISADVTVTACDLVLCANSNWCQFATS